MKNLNNQIEFTRINNDINGNPRYVCHYLAFKPITPVNEPYKSYSYEEALFAAKALGGRKFHNKQYGGGIVFQSYNIIDEIESILELTGEAIRCHREPTKGELKFGNGATHYRTFMREDITNRKGELKKWFKADDDKLNYSTK
jgi:hypothetical protein